jgi:radical SAM superfamily enzyme YgiQ (UPF0313 family)
MAKRILLVDPPFHAFFEYEKWWYTYSCAQLAGSLLDKGIEAFIYDGDKYFKKDPLTKERQEMVRRQEWYQKGVSDDEHPIWKHFYQTLKQLKPDIVGVTVWTCSLRSGLKILKMCKEFNPEIKTCVGGYHVLAQPDYFKNRSYIDAIFVGPAEQSLSDWILGGCKENFIKTDPCSIDIKNIPAPSRESLLYPEYFTSTDMGMLMTSRGCPFNCSFCSNKLLTGLKYQFRTVEQVREELEHIIKKYCVEYLNIVDANFLANRKNALRMAELFKSSGIPWGCVGLIAAIDEDFLKKLIDCGCINISFGIESGNQSRLNKLNKKINLVQIEKASVILNKYKMKWKTFFICGYPDDTLEEMEETRRFALKIKPSYISLNSFTPLPGTDIYRTWENLFKRTIDDLSEYNQLNPKASFMQNMDPRVYQEKFNSVLNDFDAYNKQVNSVDKFKGKINV